ncbi:MAG TPA: site-2 protease family protein [Candidatus Marinimicrobia bacterium]|nr:site-2 protease family protein [Candidatus Neomarinimicrobiota bacterium]HRS52600.1 site-2 protease family protein [Candidatus Neomarinimicrobiota bacterium]HRU92604.1 site-2 protease family protein [Candidatus Neomarinimicrobiota bacterium]
MNIQIIILLIPPILLALTFHEYMHGWAAYKMGDPTAKMAGRLTMNPMAHLDPIGTLMLFLVHFGWARPVPIDPRYFRNPKRDMLIVAAAGPLANMFVALLSGLLARLFQSGYFNFLPLGVLQAVYTMVILSLQINLALAIFNLLPIPPLDGSKILMGLIPPRYEAQLNWLERYGSFILMAVIIIGMVTNVSILGAFINPFVNYFSQLFGGI